jgi:hypothetical protein
MVILTGADICLQYWHELLQSHDIPHETHPDHAEALKRLWESDSLLLVYVQNRHANSDYENLLSALKECDPQRLFALLACDFQLTPEERLRVFEVGADECMDQSCSRTEIICRIRNLLRYEKEREL